MLKILFKFGKTTFLSKTVFELIDDDGKQLSSGDDILNEQHNLYIQLYSSRHN